MVDAEAEAPESGGLDDADRMAPKILATIRIGT